MDSVPQTCETDGELSNALSTSNPTADLTGQSAEQHCAGANKVVQLGVLTHQGTASLDWALAAHARYPHFKAVALWGAVSRWSQAWWPTQAIQRSTEIDSEILRGSCG